VEQKKGYMNILTLKQQIKAAPKYTLQIEGAGYLANEQGLSGIKFTNDIKKARQFAVGFDNPVDKAGIWNTEAKRMFNNSAVTFNIVNI